MDLSRVIRDIPDFPKPGILFRDITPILEQPEAFRTALSDLTARVDDIDYDAIAGIESRGFIFAAPLCRQQGKPLVLIRKAGKLPMETLSASYELEYGEATLEMHTDSVAPDAGVLIVDDLLATGGTAAAAAELVQKAGGRVAGFVFVVELADLAGREKLEATAPVFSLVSYS